MNTLVTYTDDHGRWQYVHCARHKPRRSDPDLRDITEESTDEACTLGCNPALNRRVSDDCRM